MAANKTVFIEGDGRRLEFDAGGILSPGHLLERESDGDVVVHNSAGELAYRWFALEDDLQGNDIDDAYAADERVQIIAAAPGAYINALLADGETAVIGSILVSAGDGTLAVQSSEWGEWAIAIAMEAVDMSDSTGADPSARIKVLVL